MTLTVYRELEQRSEEWYAARAGIVTASTVGRLITPTLKVADNDTSRQLLLTLAAERITGRVEDTPMSSEMWRGVEDEPLARDHYSQTYAPVEEVGFMVRTAAAGNARLGFSPDGLVSHDGLVEFKSRLQKKQVDVFLSDAVPPVNVPQLMAGLLVSGREWIDYCSFTPGMPMYRKRIYPDMQWFDAITAAVLAAEERITELVDQYQQATEGLPLTEPRVDLDDIF